MKFGGTSMAGTERIRRVANIVRRQQAAGHEVAVVVSAMSGETDRLLGFCREANALYDPAEHDVVVASGEQVTAGLLAMTLQAIARCVMSEKQPPYELHGMAFATATDIVSGQTLGFQRRHHSPHASLRSAGDRVRRAA